MFARVLTFAAILAAGLTSVSHAEGTVPFPTGYRDSTPEERAEFESYRRLVTTPEKGARDLPASVANIEHLPTVGLQVLGTCTSWAVVYYCLGHERSRAAGAGRYATPGDWNSTAFPFRLIGQLTQGSSVSGNINILRNYGTCSFAAYPETGDLFNTTAGVDAWREAIGRTVTGATELQGLDAIKAHLASGRVAATIIETNWSFDTYSYSSFENPYGGVDNDVIFAFVGPTRGGHAVTIVGYDDNRPYNDGTGEKHGALLLVNSWGTDWGVGAPGATEEGGFCWVAYDVAPTVAYAVDLEQPTRVVDDWAWIEWSHPRKTEMRFTAVVGDRDRPEATMAFDQHSGQDAYDGMTGLDLSTPGVEDAQSVWLAVSDAYIPYFGDHLTGWIEDFHVEQAGHAALQCCETPVRSIERDPPTLPPQYLVAARVYGEEATYERAMDGAAAVADVDGDGDVDAYIGTRLHLNDGTGALTPEVVPLGTDEYGMLGAEFGDYNRDGWPDLVLLGYDASDYRLHVLENRQGTFVDTPINLVATPLRRDDRWFRGTPQPHWVDIDWDGDLDLIAYRDLFRNDGHGGFVTEPNAFPEPLRWYDRVVDFDGDGLYDWGLARNRGDGTFEDWSLDGGAAPEAITAVGWSDFDSDGDLDPAIACSVIVWVSQSSWKIEPVTRVYRNTGSAFELVVGDLFGVDNPTLRWADVTNDGRPDLLMSGTRTYVSGTLSKHDSHMIVFRQRADGTFVEAGYPLDARGEGPIVIADLDEDADLDWIYGGRETPTASTFSFQWSTKQARNENADPGNGNRPNAAPQPPGWKDVWVWEDGGSAYLLWGEGSDVETTAPGLSYRVRVGRTPGGHEVLSAAGPPEFNPMRGTESQHGFRLYGLTPGTYYWSVQAIDAGLRTSEWMPEGTFTLTTSPNATLGDLNRDLAIDTSDVRRMRRILAGQLGFDSAADFDGNGTVEASDLDALLDVVAGDFGAMPPGVGVIDSDGGSIEVPGCRLDIPQGAFDRTATVRLTAQPNVGFADPTAMSNGFTIAGLPFDTAKPLTLSLTDTVGATTPLVGIGMRGFSRSLGAVAPGWLTLPAERPGDGTLRVQLPVPDAESFPARGNDDYQLSVGVLGGYATLNTPHFSIGFPVTYVGDPVERLADALEAAYNRFRAADMGFSYARRTKWPLTVTVYNMGTPDGAQYSSAWGVNYGWIEINQSILSNAELTRTTAGHEFFHIVQSFYDPRNRVTAANWPAPHYWIDEAMSTWSEQLFASSSASYVPAVWTQNANETYEMGWMPPSGLDTTAQAEHGYGMASMMRWLVARHGLDFPRRVYDYIYSRYSPVSALRVAAGDTLLLWYRQYCEALTMAQVYDVPAGWALGQVSSHRTHAWKSGEWTFNAFPVMDDMSSALFKLERGDPNYVGLPDGCSLGVRMLGDTDTELTVFTSSAAGVEVAERPWAVEGESIVIVPDLKARVERNEVILPLIINNEDDEPHTNVTNVRLECAVLRNDTMPLPAFSMYGSYFGEADVPRITLDTPTITPAEGQDLDILSIEGAGVFLWMQTWADSSRTFRVHMPVILSETTATSSWDGNSIEVGPLLGYRVEGYTEDGSDVFEYENTTGDFDIPVPEKNEAILVTFYARYTMTEKNGENEVVWTGIEPYPYGGLRIDWMANY